jgi:hypothetical protein
MQKAIVVQPDGTVEIKYLDGWKGIKSELNGGYLELVPVSDGADNPGSYILFVDEDGISKELGRNQVATEAASKMLAKVGRTFLPGDYIKGVAVFIGQSMSNNPEEGCIESDLPQEVIDEYFGSAIQASVK